MTTRTRQAKLNALIKEAKSDNLKIVARGGWHIIYVMAGITGTGMYSLGIPQVADVGARNKGG